MTKRIIGSLIIGIFLGLGLGLAKYLENPNSFIQEGLLSFIIGCILGYMALQEDKEKSKEANQTENRRFVMQVVVELCVLIPGYIGFLTGEAVGNKFYKGDYLKQFLFSMGGAIFFGIIYIVFVKLYVLKSTSKMKGD